MTHFTCCFSFFQNIGSHKEKAGERRGVGAVEVPSIISSGKILLKSTNWIQLNMQLSTLKAPRNAGVRRKQRTFFQPKYNDHRGRRSGWWLCDRETLCDVYIMTRESPYVGAWSNHQLISSCVSKHIQGKIFFYGYHFLPTNWTVRKETLRCSEKHIYPKC